MFLNLIGHQHMNAQVSATKLFVSFALYIAISLNIALFHDLEYFCFWPSNRPAYTGLL